jgi:hypothetical protein
MELTHAEIEQLYSEASVRAYRPEAVLPELADGYVFQHCASISSSHQALTRVTQNTRGSCVT